MIPRILVLLLVLAGAAPASAVSISGIMVYSADDFGTPSGFDTFDRPEAPQMHMWRTYTAGIWHSLAIYEGLPPQSLTGRPRPLNGSNFSVDIPLIDGENFFTIVGEPGPITATDTYQRFVVNLYFDGGLNAPGISALFPRYAPEEGGVVSANRSQYLYSFDVTLAQQRSPGIDDSGYDVYDDGYERVTITGASFLPEDRFMSADLVGPQRFGESGTADFIGSLVILVEPSEGGPVVGGFGGGGTGRLGGVPASGGLPGGGRTGADPGVGGAPYVPGYAAGGGVAAGAADDDRWDTAAPRGAAGRDEDDGFEWVSGDEIVDDEEDDLRDEDEDDDSQPRDVVSALRNWIVAAAEETPTPDDEGAGESDETATPDGGTPTPGDVTPTPALTKMVAEATATSATATPATSTPATSTPTRTPTPDATATMNAASGTPQATKGKSQP